MNYQPSIKIIIVALIFNFSFLISNFSAAQTTFFHRYIIQFTDKGNSPYSLEFPQQYLSQRAIDRRSNQNLSLDSLDLPVNPVYIDSVASTGVLIFFSSKWLNCVAIFTNDSLALQTINNFSFVKGVKIVGKNLLNENHVAQYNSSNEKISCDDDTYYGFAYDQINQVRANYLHNEGYKGEGMIIAYLDAGFNNVDVLPVFAPLRNRNGILYTHDFVLGNDSVYEDAPHGAMCLSIVAGNMPGYYVGTAPEADFILLRTEEGAAENPIEEINWAAGAESADSMGADVITSSLGYSVFDTSVFNHTFQDMNGKTNPSSIAAHIASTRGMIVCNSAGNSGDDQSWRFITAPGDADGILTVGAIDSANNYAIFSGHGPTFDGRTKPDVVARGANTWVINSGTNGVMEGNGTSFSCPLIAGCVACLWQAHPEKNNLEIMDAVRLSASKYYTPDNNIGYGIPNFAYADLLLGGFNESSLLSADSVFVYPTIFSDDIKINIKSKDLQQLTIKLFDLSGRLVSEDCTNVFSGFNSISIHPQNISGGIYFLKISSGEKCWFEKIVKQ